MLAAVIIDNETNVRETLKQMLHIYCPNINVTGEAEGVESGYRVISRLNPDVVFLDMQMNDGNGFDLLKKFIPVNFQVIIVTAYQEYAIRAFKYSALDYLLKPIDANDLVEAVEKLSKSFNQQEAKNMFDALLSNTANPNPSNKKLVLKTLNEIHVVDTSQIIRCESHNNITEFFFCNTATPVRVSRTLKEFEDILSDCNFVRCHQSHLINIKHIVRVIKHPSPSIKMSDECIIPVSIRKKEILKLIDSKA
ncbi:MAG: LytR/AlgR family response regulator transcription factor [Bacteroidales bacterium]